MTIVSIKDGSEVDIDTLVKAINTNADAMKEIVSTIEQMIEAINKLNQNQLFNSLF